MKKLFITYALVTVLFLTLPIIVDAKKTLADADSALVDVVGPSGIDESDIGQAAGSVVQGVLGAVGLLFFCLMVYAGMVWMTAQGDDARVTKARDTIIAASIGMVIIVASYAITNLVVERIINTGKPIVGGASNDPEAPSPNTIGGEALGCCILPVDYFSLGSAIPSVGSETDCDNKAKEILGDSFVTDYGKTWNYYEGEGLGTTEACVEIAKCWVGNAGVSSENACIKKITDKIELNAEIQAAKQAAADAAAIAEAKKDWKWCIIDKECVEGNPTYCPADVYNIFNTKDECNEALSTPPQFKECMLNTPDPCLIISQENCTKEKFCQKKDSKCVTSITEAFCNASSEVDCGKKESDGEACILKNI
ncbi:MAG: hypothetical protein A2821_04085 [Candidatus Magasanikbacteria bacterium RIFCSPHIGHO2_01_FULL_41_23]|uniref:Uncharacterized protein n=1 Tax=Candidatus Magasanikbacteria bacterium RIFCSPLOWO2_01_FULL_40_15 TaxID=1798686 RepID=A0A1F6N3L0_9BACT|nr:MAG: hypothetical protein A2821_04085 [Candidatus Magasanikbacteria bacterium RIFCSPHIGHO2_01_FULL_41_23]OGH76346.1 MAG: hypothetical protein A3F22_04420 [Candidatus Magasanikbacteria bacterium RIFCSPHIGHO2_12_FULL_41_16]OGH78338.1 MAG: hypothetical protein A2983_01085 [Candidatus Magasanikbacteria bacterium RIFCSPLOWO2_01_FULL_40_15]